MSIIPFKHKMAAHCESGTVTSLLNHAGLEITEPMVFGIASGIFFGYFHTKKFPFPMFVVRTKPGEIRSNIAKRLNVKFKTAKFTNPMIAERELDKLLEQNIPVAVQVDFFYLDYNPLWTRVHINVHFITVIGKNGSKYIISDSYYPDLVELDRESMLKARFAGGNMAPKGFMYYVTQIPLMIDWEKAIIKGIRIATFYMLKIPVPFLGIKGIRMLARKIVDWPRYARDTEHLSHEIMKINLFLEEQGTGGGGFRFIYASFLREASEKINNPELLEFSKKIMAIGDEWRIISLFAARIGKNRDLGPDRLRELSDKIMERADEEKIFFTEMREMIK